MPSYVPVGMVASIFNLSIGATKRKFKNIEKGGMIDVEGLNEWIEKHSEDVRYPYWVKAIEALEKHGKREGGE